MTERKNRPIRPAALFVLLAPPGLAAAFSVALLAAMALIAGGAWVLEMLRAIP